MFSSLPHLNMLTRQDDTARNLAVRVTVLCGSSHSSENAKYEEGSPNSAASTMPNNKISFNAEFRKRRLTLPIFVRNKHVPVLSTTHSAQIQRTVCRQSRRGSPGVWRSGVPRPLRVSLPGFLRLHTEPTARTPDSRPATQYPLQNPTTISCRSLQMALFF